MILYFLNFKLFVLQHKFLTLIFYVLLRIYLILYSRVSRTFFFQKAIITDIKTTLPPLTRLLKKKKLPLKTRKFFLLFSINFSKFSQSFELWPNAPFIVPFRYALLHKFLPTSENPALHFYSVLLNNQRKRLFFTEQIQCLWFLC